MTHVLPLPLYRAHDCAVPRKRMPIKLPHASYELGSQRVEMDVPDKLEQVWLLFTQD